MNYAIIKPTPRLATFVRFYWFIEGNMPYVHHAYAYPCAELVFCYKGHFRYGVGGNNDEVLTSAIFGQTETFSRITLNNEGVGIMGIYFYPHALPQLFNLPANQLTNQYADVRTILGGEARALEEQIALASNNQQRAKLVSDVLEARLKNVRTENLAISLSITAMVDAFQASSVKAMADRNCLSPRQFERRFKELSGFTPKTFLRLMRFNAVINMNHQQKSLTEIGIECGYYDQSHFIHDFREFSGVSPKQYFNNERIAAADRGTVEF